MNRLLMTISMMALILTLGAGCQSLTGKTMGRHIDDATVTTWVKSKLSSDKAMNFTRVSVKTDKGIVYLTGSVETAADRERIEKLTKSVDGVKSVVSHLTIQ